MRGASYTPGEWHAIVTGRCALLVEKIEPACRAAVWQAMTDDRGLESVLDAVSGGRLTELPAFALAGTTGEGIRLLLRPGLEAVVDRGTPREQTITCDAWRTWADVLLDPGSRVSLARGGSSIGADSWPLLGGAVAADELTWPFEQPQVTTEPEAPAQSLVPPSTSVPAAASAPIASAPIAAVPVASALPSPEPADRPDEQLADDHAVLDGAAGRSGYFEALWGLTRPRTVEDAAVRRDDEDEGGSVDASALLDVIPGLSTGTTPVSTTDTVIGVLPAAARGQILAIACRAGHPNPPRTPTCRECAITVDYTEPTPMTRPRLGVLRFSTGQTVGLDRSVLIGRNPVVSRVGGDELPVVIPLDSATKDISRTHAEVRLDDWDVLLVDHGSSNGTFAVLPGRGEQRLQAQVPMHLVPGTVVRLANDVTFVFEVR